MHVVMAEGAGGWIIQIPTLSMLIRNMIEVPEVDQNNRIITCYHVSFVLSFALSMSRFSR